MKRSSLFVLFFLLAGPALGQDEGESLNIYYGEIPEGNRTFFVAPEGENARTGTEEEPWATLDYAITQVQRGDVIVMRGGIYDHDDIVRIQTPSGFTDELIVVVAYPGEVPILDFSNQPKERNYHGVRLNANWWHIIGITIRNASHNGIRMDGSFNILEQVTAYGNHDSGIHMAGFASNNVIKNCDSFHNFNYDTARTPRVGNNADGFSAKFDIGPGNRYYGCRSWENSDDGFDFWEAESTIRIDNTWAFGNGDASVFGDPDNFEGNGNGFKLGGNHVVADHVVLRSMAFDNFGASGNAKGFDYNNNRGAMTLIHNTAYNNGRNYYFPLDPPGGQAVFVNNLSAATSFHAATPPSAVLAGNSWQSAAEITDDMFLSVDTELAKRPRETDGSLPVIDLLKPVPGSVPVDGGVVLADPFYGAAPDIGAYEHVAGELVDPATPIGSGSVVADVVVYDMDHAADWAVQSDLDEGMDAFGDHSATIGSVPSGVHVDEWIRTSIRTRTKNYLLSTAQFTLRESRDVFVAHADAVADKPEWLADYEETELKLTLVETDGSEQEMTLYQRNVEAGEVVTLGRNSRDGSTDVPMYAVIVGSRLHVAVENPAVPNVDFRLGDAYPNPFGDRATISFGLSRDADVSIKIYDTLGREIATVTEGYHRAGSHSAVWDAKGLSNGVYYCHMTADGFSAVKKLIRIG